MEQIELIDGKPSYSLDADAYRGDGTERLGYGNGPRPIVNFEAKPVQQSAMSLAAGKPIFRTIVFMRLQHPGERDFILRPATREDVNRFAPEYRNYCANREQRPEGAPLEVLFPHLSDVVTTLHFHRVYTVEMLAALTDTQLQNLGMGGYEWQAKARRWLDGMAKGAGFAEIEERQRKVSVENQRLSDQNTQLVAQVQALSQQVQQLTQHLTAGGMLPPILHSQAPAAAAAPMQAANIALSRPGQPLPGEIGADEHVSNPESSSTSPQQEPALDALMAQDAFQDDLVPVQPAADAQPSKRRK